MRSRPFFLYAAHCKYLIWLTHWLNWFVTKFSMHIRQIFPPHQQYVAIVPLERIWKLVHVCQSYYQKSSGFFEPHCRYLWCSSLTVCATVPRSMREGIIIDCIAMHTKRDVARLGTMWYKSFFRQQPLGQSTVTVLLLFLFYLNPPLLRLTSGKPLWLDLQPVDIKSQWRHNWKSA